MTSVIDGITILPGENVLEIIESHKDDEQKKIITGPGLKKENVKTISSYNTGQLLHRSENRFWINSHHRYYIPNERDHVIGIVISKASLQCRVDIGASEAATLSLLAFPNATKRNKGIVEIGDIIYACVLSAAKDVDTELVCMDKHGKKNGLGVLPRGGYMIKVPLNICRRLLATDSKISQLLGQKFRYESAIGLNGRIWINSRSMETTILISNFIRQLEYIPNQEQEKACSLLL